MYINSGSQIINFLFTLLILAAASCNKTKDNTTTPLVPTIVSVNPQHITTGAVVNITGEHFGSNSNNMVVTLDTVMVAISVLSDSTVSFIVPDNLLSSGSKVYHLKVTVNGIASNIFPLTIMYALHGWQYVNNFFTLPNSNPATGLYFFDDMNGFVYGQHTYIVTSNGGANWLDVISSNPIGGEGYAYSVNNAGHVWVACGGHDFAVDKHDWRMSVYARVDTITTIPGLGYQIQHNYVTGLYSTHPEHGYLLTGDGLLFKFNGGYAPANISLEFKSRYANPTGEPNIHTVYNYYRISGIDSMNFMFAGIPVVNGVVKPMVIHKHNGVYHETDLSAQLGNDYPLFLQYVDKQTAYMLTADKDLYTLDFTNDKWEKLPSPKLISMYFVDTKLGYACGYTDDKNYNYIFKTTDGGITWNIEYALNFQQYVNAFFARDGLVWAFGMHDVRTYFLLKYTP